MASSPWPSDKEDPLLPQFYTGRDLDAEDAEGAVLDSIERRHGAGTHERQPQDEERLYHAMNASLGEPKKENKRSLKDVVRRVQKMNTVTTHLKRNSKASRYLQDLKSDDEPDGLMRPMEYDVLDLGVLHERDSLDSSDSSNFRLSTTSSKRSRSAFHRFSPLPTIKRIFRALHVSLILWVAIPLSMAAYVLYYHADDPEIDFLPGEATLSWWLNFAARLCVTLELAFVTQWLLVDCVLLRTRFAGPLVTLTFLQAKGWPFVIAVWSLLNLIFLQGDNRFQRHWLYWTNWDLYSTDVGDFVLMSGIYLRLLVSGLIAGCLTAVKRTFIALNFGGRQLNQFKSRLERILADVVILSEIACLATQAEGLDNHPAESGLLDLKETALQGKRHRWPSVDFQATHFSDEDGHQESAGGSGNQTDIVPDRRDALEKTSTSGILQIKELLDPWQEPVNRRDKSTKPTIGEFLRFRRALSLLHDAYPFGEEFGRAATRDECIMSSHKIFGQLVRLRSHKKKTQLSVEVLESIAVEEDGTEDSSKKKAIRKLFRPDASNKLTLLAFVQSCDSIYKRFRYFRASVSNASVINDVLERITNAIFFLVLVLLLLSVLQVNPWTLLFSMTSLLVSLSFALGPSVSKYVEGALLIAVRRPFDLGDRIFMSSADSINPRPNVTSQSWYVEDITLTTTTLRYARTNEVSTVSNSDIAGLRIVNCNQSPLATVFLEMNLHMSIFDNDNLKRFRSALDKYVADRPRTWDSVSFCRHDDFDADNEKVRFAISVRHCLSWQDAAKIKRDRADLLYFLYVTSKALFVHYEEPPPQQVQYHGGVLKQGDIDHGYKRELLFSGNIQSGANPFSLPMERTRPQVQQDRPETTEGG